MNRVLFSILCQLVLFSPLARSHNRFASFSASAMADTVVEEFVHGYSAYQKYAWGHDELLPLTASYVDYGSGYSTLWTPIDALDTIYIMNLTDLASQTKDLICHFNFSINADVAEFDSMIRLLGGLLSAYHFSGETEECLLQQAIDLGNRIYPIFIDTSPSGFPYQDINLQTGAVNKQAKTTNPAIVGTAIIEYGCLSYLTGDMKYYNVAKNNLQLLRNAQSSLGFVGSSINLTATSSQYLWPNPATHIDAGIDSYYEYLLKCWKLFGDEDCRTWWNSSLNSIVTYLHYYENQNLWFVIANMYTGQPISNGDQYDLYAAFFAAELALGGEINLAIANQNANWQMWESFNIEPSVYNFATGVPVNSEYDLNPENFESNYYLYVFTNDTLYYNRAVDYFNDIVTYCKCETGCVGYSALIDVVSKTRQNSCPSYFFAESMKYLYLTFLHNLTITQGTPGFNFNDYIFNTEAHPLPKKWGNLF